MDANLKLSQARAEAVVQALIRDRGIAAARLKFFGTGAFAPVASNDAEDGQAKNRRVELVKQQSGTGGDAKRARVAALGEASFTDRGGSLSR